MKGGLLGFGSSNPRPGQGLVVAPENNPAQQAALAAELTQLRNAVVVAKRVKGFPQEVVSTAEPLPGQPISPTKLANTSGKAINALVASEEKNRELQIQLAASKEALAAVGRGQSSTPYNQRRSGGKRSKKSRKQRSKKHRKTRRRSA
jgi:hypothetical protein